jgi:tetratricopeptide (TPR) repeat protein
MCETTPRPSAGTITGGRRRAGGEGAVRRALRGDLDAIVMTAIAAEPERRYASVEQLAADVDRHLKHEPVVARAPGAAYLLSRWVRRHRALVAAAGVALLALAAGAAGLVRGSEKAKRQAESTQRVNTLLREMLIQLEPTSARGFESSLQRQLHFANQELEKGLLKDEPGLELDLRLAMGRVYGSLGYPGWASEQFEKALELARRAGATRGALRPHCAARLAKRAARAGAAAEGGCTRSRSPADRRTRRELVLAQGSGSAHRAAPFATPTQWSTRRARNARRRETPRTPDGRPGRRALNRLGRRRRRRRSARARRAWRSELFRRRIRARRSRSRQRARAAREGRAEEASSCSRGLEIALYDSKNPVIAWSLALLADVQCAAGRANEAVPLLEEALAIRKLHFEADSAPRMESLLQLGLALVDAGEPESALKPLREALAIADRRRETRDPRLPRARQEFARLISDATSGSDAANAPKGGH